MSIFEKIVTDLCTICVRKKQERYAILIPSKIEQEIDSHADQRGFCFAVFVFDVLLKSA